MADIPETIIAKAAGAVLDLNPWSAGFIRQCDAGQAANALARAALDAVAEALGEHCAAAIAEHAERQHPRYPGQIPSAWDRHFSIAARVASRAFLTEDDLKRLAGEALARGDFAVCEIPEGNDG